jgi:ribose 5-phosphate isomerase A
LRANPTLRLRSEREPFITDGANYVFDCAFGPVQSATELQRELDGVVGVIEHGLFIGLASQLLIGGPQGVKQLSREKV